MDMIKVSANSRTSAVAGAIAGVVREHKRAEVQAIGAGAVNQSVKALVLAIGYLKNDNIAVVCIPMGRNSRRMSRSRPRNFTWHKLRKSSLLAAARLPWHAFA